MALSMASCTDVSILSAAAGLGFLSFKQKQLFGLASVILHSFVPSIEINEGHKNLDLRVSAEMSPLSSRRESTEQDDIVETLCETVKRLAKRIRETDEKMDTLNERCSRMENQLMIEPWVSPFEEAPHLHYGLGCPLFNGKECKSCSKINYRK